MYRNRNDAIVSSSGSGATDDDAVRERTRKTTRAVQFISPSGRETEELRHVEDQRAEGHDEGDIVDLAPLPTRDAETVEPRESGAELEQIDSQQPLLSQ